MTRQPDSPEPLTATRIYQCPGCWSVSTNPMTTDGYECECGERLFIIDLRDTEPSPFAARSEVDWIADGETIYWHDSDGEAVTVGEAMTTTEAADIARARNEDVADALAAMARRSSTDPEWADEVIRRWNRRRFRVQQREKAMSDLAAAIEPVVIGLDRLLRRWPWLYRILGGRDG